LLGETRDTIDPDTAKWKIALRDAFAVFLFTLISTLLAYGYPPTAQALYVSVLSGALTGVTSFMHALGIKKPRE